MASARRSIAVFTLIALAAISAARCSGPPPDPLRLDGNLLTVDNQTAQDWHDVQIFLNLYYRAAVPKIAARGVFKAPLDVFVDGYARRFSFTGMQIRSLRLTAKLPSGEPLELTKQFQLSGVAGALGGKQ